VVEPETGALDATDRLAVDLDLVGQRRVVHGCFEHLAVHGHAAFHDHALDIATRCNAGAGEQLGNALGLHGLVAGRCLGARRTDGLRRGLVCGGCGRFSGLRLAAAVGGLARRTPGLVFECHLLFACGLGCRIRSRGSG